MKHRITVVDQVVVELPVEQSRRVVLVDVAGRKDLSAEETNANIYCVDSDGQIIWQVDAPAPRTERDSFVSLRQTEQGIRADRFFGSEMLIDVFTGIAKEIGWHK